MSDADAVEFDDAVVLTADAAGDDDAAAAMRKRNEISSVPPAPAIVVWDLGEIGLEWDEVIGGI